MAEPVTPLSPGDFAGNIAKADDESYVHKDFVAFDQFVNVLADGNPDETISSRMARWATEEQPGSLKHRIGTGMCDFLNLFQKDHGAVAEASDLGRAKAVEHVEEATPTVKAEESK
ncbi:MAG: hypothetical protein KGL39_18455 [Patescibacteria group bacterium]|nr:hypothetical protein [Patescibacteria group bacterium]